LNSAFRILSESRLAHRNPHVDAYHLIAAAAMAPTDALSAPGAVAYSSDKMSVGDGTWDFTKNDFLIPNLQGLPFEMMQYNGKHTPPPTLSWCKHTGLLTPVYQAWATAFPRYHSIIA